MHLRCHCKLSFLNSNPCLTYYLVAHLTCDGFDYEDYSSFLRIDTARELLQLHWLPLYLKERAIQSRTFPAQEDEGLLLVYARSLRHRRVLSINTWNAPTLLRG